MVKKIRKTHVRFESVEDGAFVRPLYNINASECNNRFFCDGYEISRETYKAIMAILD